MTPTRTHITLCDDLAALLASLGQRRGAELDNRAKDKIELMLETYSGPLASACDRNGLTPGALICLSLPFSGPFAAPALRTWLDTQTDNAPLLARNIAIPPAFENILAKHPHRELYLSDICAAFNMSNARMAEHALNFEQNLWTGDAPRCLAYAKASLFSLLDQPGSSLRQANALRLCVACGSAGVPPKDFKAAIFEDRGFKAHHLYNNMRQYLEPYAKAFEAAYHVRFERDAFDKACEPAAAAACAPKPRI